MLVGYRAFAGGLERVGGYITVYSDYKMDWCSGRKGEFWYSTIVPRALVTFPDLFNSFSSPLYLRTILLFCSHSNSTTNSSCAHLVYDAPQILATTPSPMSKP